MGQTLPSGHLSVHHLNLSLFSPDSEIRSSMPSLHLAGLISWVMDHLSMAAVFPYFIKCTRLLNCQPLSREHSIVSFFFKNTTVFASLFYFAEIT